MARSKKPRQKGKMNFSRMFQDLKKGDRVCLGRELSMSLNVPGRMHGRTGIIEGMRGRSFIVKVMDHGMEKTFIIQAAHLSRLK